MNKLSCNKKLFLAIGILFAVAALFLAGPVDAAISYPPSQTAQAMTLPAPVGSAAAPGVLLDNFEYWETPQNHGWTINHPGMPGGYPLWGIGVGIGAIETVIDFQEGSRVLEAYMPATLFVPNIERFSIVYQPTIAVPVNDYSVFSVKMRSPVAVENFDTYEFVILTTAGIEFHLIPRAASGAAILPVTNAAATAEVMPPEMGGAEAIAITVGKENADGSWHQIAVDLAEAYWTATGNYLAADQALYAVYVFGNQYRMDDMQMMNAALAARVGVAPYLFHINHIYQQIFDNTYGGTTRYIFVSDPVGDSIYPVRDYSMHPSRGHVVEHGFGNTYVQAMLTGGDLATINANLWITHKINQGAFSVAADPAELANIDPALTAAAYQAAVAAADAAFVAAGSSLYEVKLQNPGYPVTLAIGVGGIDVTLPAVDVYTLDGPQLLNAEMAVGPQTPDGGVNQILFSANIGGAHDLGTCADGFIQPVALDEPLRYIPLYCHSSAIPCCGDQYNGFLGTQEIAIVAQSLALAGYTTWPAVAKIVIPPEQIMENLILTVVASNGMAEDVEALSIITTNYPVTNYPPVIEDVDDQIFYVGCSGNSAYQLNATDADSFTINAAGQLAGDMDQLIWAASINGLPSYMYGPWTESIIDQKTGLVSFCPEFEGAYELVASVRDQDGAEAAAAFVVHCINSQTWLNHPPIMLGDWDHPMLGYAGVPLTLDFSGIVDPDGGELFFSCNIGTIGVRPGHEGHVVWEFQTMYPGTYMVEIVAYDTQGGYIVIPQEVIISPWWSM